ncbi:MAG: hypothetical protein Q4D90_09255, partial [bacterium]|nr:hypothetical protein [bacterium]
MKKQIRRREAAMLLGGVLTASVLNPFAAAAAQATGPAALLESQTGESSNGESTVIVIPSNQESEQNTGAALTPGGPASPTGGEESVAPEENTQTDEVLPVET